MQQQVALLVPKYLLTSTTVQTPYTNICVFILPYVSSYYYFVLILLYICPHTTLCVLILPYMCPHTTRYVSSTLYICVLILLYMCPHTSIHVSSYCYKCVLRNEMFAFSFDIRDIAATGTQFTCITGTKVQKLTQKALLSQSSLWLFWTGIC